MADNFETVAISAALPEGDHGAPITQARGFREGWGQPDQPSLYDPQVAGWEGNAPVYEFDTNATGDVGPEVPELEEMLFGKPELRGQNVGIDFEA